MLNHDNGWKFSRAEYPGDGVIIFCNIYRSHAAVDGKIMAAYHGAINLKNIASRQIV